MFKQVNQKLLNSIPSDIVDMIIELSDEIKLKQQERKKKLHNELCAGMCDCCLGGWYLETEFGWCHCICSRCDKDLNECKYDCYD